MATTDEPVPPADNSATPTDISRDLVGTNLQPTDSDPGQPIPPNRYARDDVFGDINNPIGVNSAAIDVNREEIRRNSVKIDQAFARIEANTAAIDANRERISDLEEGLAAVAALPDMFLDHNDTIAASGGVGIYGDHVGFGATLAIRGNENWSFGASTAFSEEGDMAGKLQVRWTK